MRKYAFLMGVLAVAMTLVFAQAAMAQCGSCGSTPKVLKDGKGPHGQAGAGCAKVEGAAASAGCPMSKGAAAGAGCPMAGRMGAGHGRGMGMMVGPVQVNPETQKMWKELERLQVKRHRAMWDMFTLLGAEKVDEAAVAAKQKELWAMTQELVAKHESLAKFQVGNAACVCPGCEGKDCKCCTGGECTCGPDCKCACCAEGGKCKCASCAEGKPCAKACPKAAAKGCPKAAGAGCATGCGAAAPAGA